MTWVSAQGTPAAGVKWPGNGNGPGASAPLVVGEDAVFPAEGAPEGLLITDWVSAVGAKLTLYEDNGATQILSWRIDFDGGAPPYLPFKIDLWPGGLSIPKPWAFRFHTTSGQFDAVLIYRSL